MASEASLVRSDVDYPKNANTESAVPADFVDSTRISLLATCGGALNEAGLQNWGVNQCQDKNF
jgi:hypothetical protein